jgi:hypothetical protein
MSEKSTIIAITICSLAGLLTVSASITAHAAECLAAPNAQSGPGTHWHYRIDQTTKQRCWYLKDLRGSSRSSSGSESPAASNPPPRGAGSELGVSAAPAEGESSIAAWFSSKWAALTGAGKTGSTTEVGELSTSESSSTRKRSTNERTDLRKPQQSKSEQIKSEQIKSEQGKSQREEGETARAQDRFSKLFVRILEAAGDKPVPNAVELAEDWQTLAIEAVGEKDVATPRIDLEEDWQRALYEEFLVWRSKQLMLQ